MFRKERMGRRGAGVVLYIKETIPAYEVHLHEEADCNEVIWCKLVTGHTTGTIGVVYRCPNITKPTRTTRRLYIVLSSQKELVDNVEIKEPLGSSDHNQMHFNINIKSDKTKVKQCRRDFRKGNYKEIRTRLTLIDGNDKMKNKTATECWNILRGEIDNAIDNYVPTKKQGKRSKKKHLSKEAFRKIIYKRNMWRVYKPTGKDTDYDALRSIISMACIMTVKYYIKTGVNV